MYQIDDNYIRILTENGHLYGGNQSRFPDKKMSGYGCGLIAAADVSLMLSDKSRTVSWEQYETYIKKIRKFFLFFNHLGMNGWFLALGLNIVFLRNHMPFFAYWKMFPMGEYSRKDITKMLDQGIPVIITAGPNFPNWFGKYNVNLYQKNEKGEYRVVSGIRSHFVTITGIEGDYLKVSSWGKAYYISWAEYLEYARKHSIFFFTNYLKIIPRKK